MSPAESPAPAGARTVKEHNRGLVLSAIVAGGARDEYPSRARLAVITGLTRATVGGLVDGLIADNLIRELEPARGERGRPGSPLQLNPDGAFGIGVEINVDYFSACVVDLSGTVRGLQVERADNRNRPPGESLRRAARLAGAMRRGLGPDAERIAGVMLALPGLVDADGRLRRAPNLAKWSAVDVVDRFRALAGGSAPVRVDNEANLAALAQLWFGGEPGLRDFVHVSGEIGIGAGIVLQGRLFRGPHGFAGELGHMVVEPGGPVCHCGGRGCLEQVAGQEALLRKADLDPVVDSIDDLVVQLQNGTPAATRAVTEAGRALGQALASAANLVDVTTVVLGGSFARIGSWLVAPIQQELAVQVVGREWSSPRVLVSALGSDAAVRGAAGSVIAAVLGRSTPNFL